MRTRLEIIKLMRECKDYSFFDTLSLYEIIKYRSLLQWHAIIENTNISIDYIIQYADELSYNEIKTYILKNRDIPIDKLFKLANELKARFSIDRLFIFNNNITREKYNKIIFNGDEKLFLRLKKNERCK